MIQRCIWRQETEIGLIVYYEDTWVIEVQGIKVKQA